MSPTIHHVVCQPTNAGEGEQEQGHPRKTGGCISGERVKDGFHDDQR